MTGSGRPPEKVSLRALAVALALALAWVVVPWRDLLAVFLPSPRAASCDGADAGACEAFCGMGDGPSCHHLGRYRAAGRFGVEDLAGARDAFSKGCAARHGPSCGELGLLERSGVGGARDDAAADRHALDACDLGEGESCGRHAALLDAEKAVERRLLGRRLAERSCSLRSAGGCTTLGTSLLDRGLPDASPALAREAFGRACVLGACEPLGWSLLRGDVGLPDHDGARVHFAACSADTPGSTSCAGLGASLLGGATPDLARGRALLEAACKESVAAACLRLGLAFGPSGPLGTDDAAAVRWLDAACSLDDRLCAGLGRALLRGTAPDREKAASAFHRSCDAGVVNGCWGLGRLLLDPKYEARDARRACAIFRDLAEQGIVDGWQLLTVGLAALPPADRTSEISLLAERCRARATLCPAYALSLLGLGDAPPVPGKRAEGLRLLSEACEKGQDAACAWRAFHLAAAGDAKGVTLLEEVCLRHEVAGCALAYAVRRHGPFRDAGRAAAALAAACTPGDDECRATFDEVAARFAR